MSSSDFKGYPECGYCKGKRLTDDGKEETGLLNHKLGFTTNKLRIDDYETLLDNGFIRSGNYL